MSDPVQVNDTGKYGILSAGGIVGAFILLVLGILHWFFALLIGGLLLFFGFGILTSKNSKDKLPGLVCIVAGALTLLSKVPFFKIPVGWLLKGGAIALLLMGIWNGIKYVLSLKNRS